MAEQKLIYDDGNMKIEMPSDIIDFMKMNKEISKLDMKQRIKILEYVTGMRDIREIKDEAEGMLVTRVLCQKLTMGFLPPELDPDKWHLPTNSNDTNMEESKCL